MNHPMRLEIAKKNNKQFEYPIFALEYNL